MPQMQKKQQMNTDFKSDKQYNMNGFEKILMGVDTIVSGEILIDLDYMLEVSNQ